MKTSSLTLRSSARQRAEAQFSGFYRQPVQQRDKSQAPLAFDAASLADLNAAVRRGLRGFTPRPEISTECE